MSADLSAWSVERSQPSSNPQYSAYRVNKSAIVVAKTAAEAIAMVQAGGVSVHVVRRVGKMAGRVILPPEVPR